VGSAEAFADLAQNAVAGFVTEPLVHRGEIVGVDEEQAKRPFRVLGLVECQTQARLNSARPQAVTGSSGSRNLRAYHENPAEAQGDARCSVRRRKASRLVVRPRSPS
jgi:hypothetical protein